MLKSTSTLFAALLLATPVAAQSPVAAQTAAPAGQGTGSARIQVARVDPGQGGFASAPLAAEGRIFAPGADCAPARPKGCSIAAYDARSGSELWQRSLDSRTGAAPTGGAAATEGAVTWVSPVYDAETNTLFVGLADSTAERRPDVTYALDARTGSVEWVRRAEPMSQASLESAPAAPARAAGF